MNTSLLPKFLTVGARGSPLSRAQVWEVHRELRQYYPLIEFRPTWVVTRGDRDKLFPLSLLKDKTNFFTQEIDELQLQGAFRIAIHSAKDLPEPLEEGLKIVALTEGVDSSDVVVYNGNTIRFGGRIGTSSLRRRESLLQWRPDLCCIDIRGTIEERLEQLDKAQFDGVVMAEAALIRLSLTHRQRVTLQGGSTPYQGRLAVLALKTDQAMEVLFNPLHKMS